MKFSINSLEWNEWKKCMFVTTTLTNKHKLSEKKNDDKLSYLDVFDEFLVGKHNDRFS